MPLVISSTPQPMFWEDACAAAKLPWPMPFIIVAPSVSRVEWVVRFLFCYLDGTTFCSLMWIFFRLCTLCSRCLLDPPCRRIFPYRILKICRLSPLLRLFSSTFLPLLSVLSWSFLSFPLFAYLGSFLLWMVSFSLILGLLEILHHIPCRACALVKLLPVPFYRPKSFV